MSISYPVLIPNPIEPLQIVFPTKIRPVGVRTNVFQEEPLDLQCLTMISAVRVVEDVSICRHTLALEFGATLERPPFVLERKQILRRRLVQHNQVVLH